MYAAAQEEKEEQEHKEAEKRKKKADTERHRNEYLEQREKAMADAMAKQQPPTGSSTAPATTPTPKPAHRAPVGRQFSGPATLMQSGSQLDPEKMTDAQRAQWVEQYSKLFNKNRPQQQQKYSFPDTIEEQTVICDAADDLRVRGNELYKKGELHDVELSKLLTNLLRRGPRSCGM